MNEKKLIFLCVSGKDLIKIRGAKELFFNHEFQVEYYDDIDKESIHSPEADYARRLIQAKIKRCEAVVCFVGDATNKSEWVLWILAHAREEGKRIIFMAMQGILKAKLDQLTADPDVIFYPWDLGRLAQLINFV